MPHQRRKMTKFFSFKKIKEFPADNSYEGDLKKHTLTYSDRSNTIFYF